MKIVRARLSNFRNHHDTAFEFGARMNVLVGDNGQGKTNALEALSFFCLTKSFYAGADALAMRRGSASFELEGTLASDDGREFRVRVAYDDAQKRKKYSINGAESESLSSVIGMFPVVVISPENAAVTFGAPGDRRKFADLVIAQSSASYMEDLLEYRRIVRQRNRILAEAQGNDCRAALEPWSEMLAAYGARIVRRRVRFVDEFLPIILESYRHIVDEREVPSLRYATAVPADGTEEELAGALRAALLRRHREELRFRTTLTGPHRDDIELSLDGLPLRQFASQGQHKTFLVALKAAEFFYLKERCRETPVFLLDDVFSELDEHRSRRLLTLTESLGQTFITAVSEKVFGGAEWNGERRRFPIAGGSLISRTAAA